MNNFDTYGRRRIMRINSIIAGAGIWRVAVARGKAKAGRMVLILDND